MPTLSSSTLSVLAPFKLLFSKLVWNHALTLLMGTILCRGKRTICSALRVMGLEKETAFSKYHHVLNRVRWSPLNASRILFEMILKLIVKDNSITLFGDETLERRKGVKIRAKGYYRDAVRSSKSVIVKSSGIKWFTLAASWYFPFSSRHFALPFLSILLPSERSDTEAKRRHKTGIQWTIQALMQVRRWAKNIIITVVGDGGYACTRLAWTCLKYKIRLISRLKINARLYDFPLERMVKTRGRKPLRGHQLISFKEMINDPKLPWREVTVDGYGNKKKTLKYISSTSLWGLDALGPVPIRWVLIVDPKKGLDPIPLMSTDYELCPKMIIELYMHRWNLEVTFEEVREHLGVETQRQWSDRAIARSTPILMSLYTIVCLIALRMHMACPIEIAKTAWYKKKEATFSDLLKAVRVAIWKDNLIFRKHQVESFCINNDDEVEIPGQHKSDDNNLVENAWIKLLIHHLAAA